MYSLIQTWCISVLLCARVTRVDSFLPAHHHKNGHQGISTLPMRLSPQPVDRMREDISRLEHEATERLQNLLDQMDDLEAFQHANGGTEQVLPLTIEELSHKHNTVVNEPTPELEADDRNVNENGDALRTHSQATKTVPQQADARVGEIAPSKMIPAKAPTDLLPDTTWRLVFNIGREEGTWMPKDWGASGERLRLECRVRFTNTTGSNHKDEDFFQSQPYRLEVSDAFIWPTAVGVGRKPLRMGEAGDGMYQIVPGDQGNILRMRVPLSEPVNRSDVTCPTGNLYITAGYFGLPQWHRQMRERAEQQFSIARESHEEAESKLGEFKQEKAWWKVWKQLSEVWKAKQDLEDCQDEYRMAQQQYPEKGHMRFDAEKRVAISKEGGLCIKILSGVAIEYHILGRVEFGCIDKEHGQN